MDNLGAGGATTIQIEVLAFFQEGTTYVLNTTSGVNGLDLAARGELYQPAAEQNYTNVVLICKHVAAVSTNRTVLITCYN
jgi:hypothetical protein